MLTNLDLTMATAKVPARHRLMVRHGWFPDRFERISAIEDQVTTLRGGPRCTRAWRPSPGDRQFRACTGSTLSRCSEGPILSFRGEPSASQGPLLCQM